MPSKPERFCSASGCNTPTIETRCARHPMKKDTRRWRGSATSRGYDTHWRRFMATFSARLVMAGIPPVCGAALPGGPVTTDSRCRAAGILTFQSADGTALQGDHEPPLEDHERHRVSSVCNLLRVQLLCGACHGSKGH